METEIDKNSRMLHEKKWTKMEIIKKYIDIKKWEIQSNKYNNNTLTLLHNYKPTYSNILHMVTPSKSNIEGWQDFIR